jgi:hypothetical protein
VLISIFYSLILMSITLLRTKVRIFFGLKKNSEGKNKKYLGERIGKIQEREVEGLS